MVLMTLRFEFPIRVLVDSSASRIHASFVLILLDAPLPQFFIILQGIAGATDVSNFLRAFLMVSLNSLSCGSMKQILVIFVRFQDGKTGLDVSCFLVNLLPDHVYPSGAFSSNRVNCVKPVQGSDKSREPSIFQ